MIRIMVVDDHPMLRDGIGALIGNQPDMELVGEAVDGESAITAFAALRPDVTLMDLQMPGIDGLSAINEIRASAPDAKIIVLTTYSGDVQATRALKAGAVGYLLKGSLRHELLDTIRKVHAGGRHILAEIAQEIALHAGEEVLSPRELQVLTLVAKGNANKQVARILSISEDTVKTHMKSVFVKLGVNDRTEAVVVAVRRGIINI